MSGWAIAAIVIGFLTIDFMIVGTLFSVLRQQWKKLCAAHPQGVLLSPHELRKRQSIRLGICNIGSGLAIVRDAASVHILPYGLTAKIIGKSGMTVPAAEFSPSGKYAVARVSGSELKVPGWVLSTQMDRAAHADGAVLADK